MMIDFEEEIIFVFLTKKMIKDEDADNEKANLFNESLLKI